MTGRDLQAVHPLAKRILGRGNEFADLRAAFIEARGLTVIASVPLSGTSGLLSAATDDEFGLDDAIVVDARRCADALDLAMTIADAAVARFAPSSQAWWRGTSVPLNAAGLALARTMSDQGVDLEPLRRGEPGGDARLDEALELAMSLAGDHVAVAIDHFGEMLASMRTSGAVALLADLRAAWQRIERLDLLLVDHPDGAIDHALRDEGHPLFRAGERLFVDRAQPDQFAHDLAALTSNPPVSSDLLGAAATLAAGAPALVWAIVELAGARGEPRADAVSGWEALRRATATSVCQQWDLLRRIHPSAQAMVVAVSLGLRPHSVGLADKTVNDALNRLRDAGHAWQPTPKRWAIADPLLAAYARDNAPPWAARRASAAKS